MTWMGETKTIYIPGVSLPFNSEANCGWHHKWRYTVPSGWTIANNDSGTPHVRTTAANFVSVTAPSNAPLGSDPNRVIRVDSEPGWSWPVDDESVIWVGPPQSQPGQIQGNTTVSQNSWEFYEVPEVDGAATYSWVIPSGWSHHHTSDPASNRVLLITGSQSGHVRVRANNACGQSNHTSKYVTVNGGGGCGGPFCFSMSPNPASGVFTLAIEEEASDVQNGSQNAVSSRSLSNGIQLNEPFELVILNLMNEVKMRQTISTKNSQIQTSDLKKGVYVVRLYSGTDYEEQKLIID